ncbi:hypothetical protein QR680_013221 [Steinernema hermaphroditum]|uniref:Moesin/ezrin/radixin homolog 1 n=1 Tax=Steinernema hermaphroditum TaxID=289476 RepID=A0AA39I4S1_9BILA|nr:hypothetical protein QR680_013221 [Steinernema hermaphroditum]
MAMFSRGESAWIGPRKAQPFPGDTSPLHFAQPVAESPPKSPSESTFRPPTLLPGWRSPVPRMPPPAPSRSLQRLASPETPSDAEAAERESIAMPGFLRSLSQRFRRAPGAGGLPTSPVASSSAYQKQSLDAATMERRLDRKECQCKVLLLDGTDLTLIVPKKATGQDVYAELFYMMDLDEHDYFGLQFTDHYHVQHWLDPLKKLNKQVPIGPPYTFRFRVKFYSSEPCNLREEITRYQFFLQLKQDVQSGRVYCPKETAAKLGALALQSEFGDFDPKEHSVLFVSEFRFHPEQDEQMEADILREYLQCKGQTPAQAELNYLNVVKWLELYGVDMHTVEGKDGNEYRLGLTPTGMIVFDGKQKIGLFCWEKIQKLDFRNRKLTIVVEEDADAATKGQIQLHTFVFNLASHKACKHLWKCAIEHHSFFRLKFHQPTRTSRTQLFRLGSTFKYRGRTEYENVHRDGRLSRRHSTFERRPSQRFGPRQSLLQNRQRHRQEIKQQIAAAAGLSRDPPPAVAPSEVPKAESAEKPVSCEGSPLSSLGSSVLSSGYHSANTVASKAAAAEARLDSLIYSGAATSPPPTIPEIEQLTQSPHAQKRMPEAASATTFPSAVSGASREQILPTTTGAQKPDTAAFVPRAPSQSPAGSAHVINIDIGDKDAAIHGLPQSPTLIPKYSAVAPAKPSDSPPESPPPPESTNPPSLPNEEPDAPPKPSGIPQRSAMSTSVLPKRESHLKAPSAIPRRASALAASTSGGQMSNMAPPGRSSRLPVISRSSSGGVKELPTPAYRTSTPPLHDYVNYGIHRSTPKSQHFYGSHCAPKAHYYSEFSGGHHTTYIPIVRTGLPSTAATPRSRLITDL